MYDVASSFGGKPQLTPLSNVLAKLPHDTTIKCFDTADQEPLTCSSHLPAARSQVFQASLTRDSKDSQSRELAMPDCCHHVMDSFLQFLQTNSCLILEEDFVTEDVMGLLKLAHKYAVKELTHVVTNIVDASEESWKHEPGSWGLILHTADKIECDHLRKIGNCLFFFPNPLD
eukprot:GHVQ01014742.1.p1 GENE.GHVQ01014742.1~~GHVQ01014742.1.p1  ORF type:complete len:173 (+),score=20.76 GHVQ01014742.1:405-923(+)